MCVMGGLLGIGVVKVIRSTENFKGGGAMCKCPVTPLSKINCFNKLIEAFEALSLKKSANSIVNSHTKIFLKIPQGGELCLGGGREDQLSLCSLLLIYVPTVLQVTYCYMPHVRTNGSQTTYVDG